MLLFTIDTYDRGRHVWSTRVPRAVPGQGVRVTQPLSQVSPATAPACSGGTSRATPAAARPQPRARATTRAGSTRSPTMRYFMASCYHCIVSRNSIYKGGSKIDVGSYRELEVKAFDIDGCHTPQYTCNPTLHLLPYTVAHIRDSIPVMLHG